MKTFFTALLAISISFSFAQTPAPQQGFDPEQNLRILGNLNPLSVGAIGFDNRYEGVTGTPLLFTDWQWGTIQFVKQDTFSTPFKLNVDLVKNTLIVQLRDGSLGELSAANVKAIQIKNNDSGDLMRWVVASEKEVEGVKSVRLKFYQAFYEGSNMRLFKVTNKIFKKANYQGAYNSGNTYDEFITEESFWLHAGGKQFEKVKIKRKDIENALSVQSAAVADLTKTHKLNLNDVKDVAKLLSLLENAEKK